MFPGAVPAVEDLLFGFQAAMEAIGYAFETVLGYGPAIYGCACQPTSPASMQVQIGRGVVTALLEVDAAGYGVLPPNTDAILKAAFNPGPLNIPGGSAFAAPGGAGTSVAYLIQAGVSETDGTPLVLSYYNANNPTQAYSGPNNSGAAQNTRRIQTVNFQVKAGAPATSGSQTAPAPDAGFSPLYIVTIPNGTTAIIPAMISVHPQAPIIPFQLPQLTPGFSRRVQFFSSTNWTVPPFVRQVYVRISGSGGGGGGCSSATGCGAGGGGGGFVDDIFTVTPEQVIPITVAQGGPGGTAAPQNGFPGGTSSFGAFASAYGGNGGIASAGGVTTGAAQGGGGVTTGSGRVYQGQNGSPGLATGNSGFVGGVGGGSPHGGGIGRPSNVGTQSDYGQFPGGGGNGAGEVALGGNGAGGLVEIWF